MSAREMDPRNEVNIDIEFIRNETPYRSWLELFVTSIKKIPEAESQMVIMLPAKQFAKYGTISLNEVAFNALKELMSSIPTLTEVNHLEGQLMSRVQYPDNLLKSTIEKLWSLAKLANYEG
jgi:hypothetical protein